MKYENSACTRGPHSICFFWHSINLFLPNGTCANSYRCWNKLRMWEWTEFDRLVYLDADMVVTRNIDHLFDLPQSPLFAVGDCYGGRETSEERDACCHFSPDCVPEYFNAGFYVMTPSHQEFRGMEDALASGSVQVGRFAEQDFLNGYFAGRWTPLPYIYNAQKRIKYHHNDIWDLSDVAVIHYVDEKPWSHRYSEENLGYQDICDLWWHIYEEYAPPSTATHRSPGPSPSPCLGLRGSNTSRSCSLEVGEKVARDEALEVHEL
jgi:lipopolysaccharide biosynthesis glycosyltransferase